MPSMVSMLWPSASAPSTRQAHTSRPSSITLQAPQSPDAQPSLLPVSCSSSRSTSKQGLLGIAQELDRIAVDGGGDVNLGHQFALARSSAIWAARRASTPATLIRYSMVPRLSSIG